MIDVDYRAMYLKVRDELAELQQREWVGLTDEEILKSEWAIGANDVLLNFARAIEAKLREKNRWLFFLVGVSLATSALKLNGTPFLGKESQRLNAGSSAKNILRFMMLEPRNQKPN
jgi:hypothetical protein